MSNKQLFMVVTNFDQRAETVEVRINDQYEHFIDATLNFDEGSITLHDDNASELCVSSMQLIGRIGIAVQQETCDSMFGGKHFYI